MAYLVPARFRPSSITALAILQIITGIVDIVFGLLIFLAYQNPGSFAGSFIGITLAFVLPPIGVAWATFGVLAFILAFAIWKGKGWGWLLGLVLATDAIVLGGFTLLVGSLAVVLPLAMYGFILIFLCLARVRAYFSPAYMPTPFIFPPAPAGWVAQPPSPYPPPPTNYGPVGRPQYSTQAPLPAQHLRGVGASGTGACPFCGAPVQADASFCFACGRAFR